MSIDHSLTAPGFRARWTAIYVIGLIAMMSLVFARPMEARQTEQELDVHAQRVLIRGLTWIQNGYPDRAAAVFSEGLKVHPSNAALLSSMATAQQAMGDLGTARFYLDQAITVDPLQPALNSQDLDLALAAGDETAARDAVNRMLQSDVDAHYLLRHLASVMDLGTGEVGRALAVQGMDLFPNDVDLVEASTRILKDLGDLEAAIRGAERLMRLRGDFDDSIRLAELHTQNGAWDEAADVLIPIMGDEFDDPELLAMLSDLDARLTERDLSAESGISIPETAAVAPEVSSSDSLGVYRQAWMDRPDDEANVVRLARYLVRNGQAREAGILVDEHVAEFPRHLDAWTLTIETWLAAGESETALMRAEDAGFLFPGYAPILLAKARALAASGDVAAALETLDELLPRLEGEAAEAARALRSSLEQPQ